VVRPALHVFNLNFLELVVGEAFHGGDHVVSIPFTFALTKDWLSRFLLYPDLRRRGRHLRVFFGYSLNYF